MMSGRIFEMRGNLKENLVREGWCMNISCFVSIVVVLFP